MEQTELTGQRRRQIALRFAAKLDKYLPEDGPLRPWKLAEIETALTKDMLSQLTR
ncbi:MAG: hypothetical protein ACC661_03235 [Verrucomicrobiales bacterium]